MTYLIAYGTDTESIEDPDQLVLLSLPDECSEMDTDDLVEYLNDSGNEAYSQPLVGLNDVLESITLALAAEGVDPAVIDRALATVFDAVDNN